ncbi:hypothetical protein Tco_1060092 [Tanacetum coccineum]
MKLQELMELYTKLSDRILDLENVKGAQALEIKKLKKRSLGDPKDASKQGRNEIDQDEGIAWLQEDSETQGRYGQDIRVNTTSKPITTASINITTVEPVTTASAPITTFGISVSTAEPSTPPTTITPVEDEDLTIAQTLMKMKSEKSKAKGVTMQEPCESRTRVRVPPPQIDPKDKGKEKMVEPEKPKKKNLIKKVLRGKRLSASCVYIEANRHLHAGREGVSIVKRNSYIDAGSKDLGGSR